MAKYKTILGVVREGASNTFATLTTWTIEESANDVEGTVVGGAAASTEPGAIGYELTCEGFYDEADGGLSNQAVGDEGVTLTVFHRGIGSGLPQAVGVYNIMSLSNSGDASDYTRFTLRAASDGSAALDRTAQA